MTRVKASGTSSPSLPALPPRDPQVPASVKPHDLKTAEKLLKSAGYHPGVVDGKPTANLVKAVKEFQGAVGIPAHGIVDARTLDALKDFKKRADHKGVVATRGEHSKDVLGAEKKLKAQGYDVGKVDGTYDRDTARAVKEFKKDHRSIKSQGSNSVGQKTKELLDHSNSRMRHAPEHQRVRITAGQKKLDVKTGAATKATNEDGSVGVGPGAHGQEVRNIQRHLKTAGFPVGVADGKFDGHLEASVKAFQKGAKLPVTGRVDGKTWGQLRKSMRDKKAPMTQGERSYDVLKAERMLKKLGYKTGKVDGFFDKNTQRASRAFEKKHKGAGNTGAIGARQLKAMKKALSERGGHGANKKVADFYTQKKNYDKVYNEVVNGWFGTTHNACVAFMTTALKHAGVDFPPNGGKYGNVRTFTTDMSNYLQKHEKWKKIGRSANLRPGDVVLTQPEGSLPYPAHTYMFQKWANKSAGIAYVVDNQGFTHERNINRAGGGFNFTPFAYALRAP